MRSRRSGLSLAALLSIGTLSLFGAFASPQDARLLMALARSAQIVRLLLDSRRGAESCEKVRGGPAGRTSAETVSRALVREQRNDRGKVA